MNSYKNHKKTAKSKCHPLGKEQRTADTE